MQAIFVFDPGFRRAVRVGLATAMAWAGIGISPATVSALERTVRVPLLLDARSPSQTQWRYTNTDPNSPDWTGAGFDESGWGAGLGGFGTGTVPGAHIITEWATPDIWLRKTFSMSEPNPESLILSHFHDESAEYYVNGVLVDQEAGWLTAYNEVYLTDEAKAALKPEGNVFAIHCNNTDGPGYIDAGLSYTVTLEATSLIADARTFPEEWKYTTTDPGQDWTDPGMDDGAWTAARAGFGSADMYSATVATEWLTPDIWMRKSITVDHVYPEYLMSLQHDDGMEVFINGTLVLQDASFTAAYQEQVVAEVAGAIKTGVNVVAIHCHNNDGPQYVDMGLVGLEKPLPTASRNASGGLDRVGIRLSVSQGRLLLGGLTAASGGRLELFGMDGRMRSAVPAGRGEATLPLPHGMGTGVFRYLWDSPSGMRRGTLVNLP